jgi:hypothetical protein
MTRATRIAPIRHLAHGRLLVVIALAACSPAVERQRSIPADTATAPMPVRAATDSAANAVTRPAIALPQTDTLRGIVERIGSEPRSTIVVRAADGSACAVQSASALPVEGLEVVFWGARRDGPTVIPGVSCTFSAERYAVRAADGVAATDGVLRRSGNAFVMELQSGAFSPLRDVPPSLRAQVGARIWWAGPLDHAPAAYGVLQPVR